MLRIENLEKTFSDGTSALRGVSFQAQKREFIVILGPSGAGKTTLLRSLIGLDTPTSGVVYLDGQSVTQKNLMEVRKKIGMIFQDFNLVSNLSVFNNVLAGLLGTSKTLSSIFYLFTKEQQLEALKCLDRVGLLSKTYSRADNLSGGQQQRVGIARAVIKRPVVLLADEPVASLDPIISYSILTLLKNICVSQDITVLCNLHQVDLALKFADRIIGLADGKIVMDKQISDVDEAYIRNIYIGSDQGLFFGPTNGKEQPLDILQFTG
jgi:phosphonate transport system ATP-binding protein